MALICGHTIVLDCLTCYEFDKSSPCVQTLAFDLDLTAGVSYYFWVIDKFGNAYRETVTVAVGGVIVPNLANYPSSFFNEFAGVFRCYLTTDAAGANKVAFTLGGVSYECFIFEIV